MCHNADSMPPSQGVTSSDAPSQQAGSRGPASEHRAEAAAAAECRGQRVPHEIRIASVTPQALAAMAEQPPESQPSTEPKPPSAVAALRAAIERAFFSGNPGLTHGMLHLMKDTGDWGSARPYRAGDAGGAGAHDVRGGQRLRAAGDEDHQGPVARPVHGAAAVHATRPRRDQFYSAKHGEPFSSLEPELTCCLAYVARVETRSRGASSPCASWWSCPPAQCADRLDEPLKGILTMPVQTQLHLRCLDKWHEASLPACAATFATAELRRQQLLLVRRHRQSVDLPDLRYVGCGRYNRRARVGTDRVWDYCGDNFRPPAGAEQGDGNSVQVGGDVPDDKLDAVTLEYTYLLTSQLESQRLYYEEQLEQAGCKPARDSAGR
uniref:Uncharacterized protein n=1 Tax=Macrostomum lignano TaxID=282301 RepID=A0A1I8FE41_9PLAT